MKLVTYFYWTDCVSGFKISLLAEVSMIFPRREKKRRKNQGILCKQATRLKDSRERISFTVAHSLVLVACAPAHSGACEGQLERSLLSPPNAGYTFESLERTKFLYGCP